MNAMRRPAGDQDGKYASAESLVRRVTSEPSGFIVHISPATNAMRPPEDCASAAVWVNGVAPPNAANRASSAASAARWILRGLFLLTWRRSPLGAGRSAARGAFAAPPVLILSCGLANQSCGDRLRRILSAAVKPSGPNRNSMFAAAVPGAAPDAGRLQGPLPPFSSSGGGGGGSSASSITVTRISLFSLYSRSMSLPKYHSSLPWKTNCPASFARLVNVTARCLPDRI